MAEHATRAGFVAVVGRPNVGKSTLVNRSLGQKVTITSRRPQTTRYRILGIKSFDEGQLIYVDTPGLHEEAKREINRYMNRAAEEALAEVDAVMFVIEALNWKEGDEYVLGLLAKVRVPVLAVVNKADQVRDKRRLLPFLDEIAGKRDFAEIIPVSAKDGTNVDRLEASLLEAMPESPPLYPEDQITDRSERFLASELVREKLMERLGEEVPYAVSVEIEGFVEKDKVDHVNAVIWVERTGQKKIVIGKGGRVLKEVGQRAREEMERAFGRKVFLQLWVKIKEDWSDDRAALRDLGYTE